MGYQDHLDAFDLVLSMDAENMQSFFHRVYFGIVFQTCFAACMSLIMWEHIIHMQAELRTWKLLLQGHILPARLAILIVRYSTLISIIFAALFIWSGTDACEFFFFGHYSCYCILWAASTSIFLMRLNIIFLGQRNIMTGYFIMWLLCLGTWIFTVTQISSTPIPQELRMPYLTICFPEPYPSLGVIAWSASVMFDCCVFFGTYLRFRTTSKTAETITQFRTRKWSFEANLYYFGTSCAFNVSCLLCILKVKDPTLSHLGSMVAMTHHCIIATRLVFSAKGWAKHVGRDDDLILNTFNKKARARMLGITYTVDETVVVDSKTDHLDNTGMHGHHQSTDHPYHRANSGPFSPTRSPTGADVAAGLKLRAMRRTSQAGGGAEPVLPLPCMDSMRTDSRDALVETDSMTSSRSGSEVSRAKQYHYRSKRPPTPVNKQKIIGDSSSYNSDGHPGPSQPPSIYFTHPFRTIDNDEERAKIELDRYKQDDEVGSVHLRHDRHPEEEVIMSPTSTLHPSTDEKEKRDTTLQYCHDSK